MKKLILLISILLIPLLIRAQDITGEWNTIIDVGGVQLPLIFHIEKNGDAYSSTLDSPDQNANGIPADTTTFINNSLKVIVNKYNIEYIGEFNSDGKFAGTFKQMGKSIPAILGRQKTEKVKLNRPQEPTEPYPYYSEDIKFENENENIFLAGTLTLPQKEGVFPAVVLITGSGPQNRNEELLSHKPFLVISDYLTRNGIAVLRFDDRGVNESEGNFKSATSKDFASDVEAAVKYLQTRKEVDKNKIGLVGHSEGGLIAPMVASNSENISYIVLLAGPGLRGKEILLMQSELIERASGKNEKDIKDAGELSGQIYDMIISAYDTTGLKEKVTEFVKQKIKENPSLANSSELMSDEIIRNEVSILTSPWFQYFLKYDPADALKKVKCPILALNGSKDLQVPAKEDLEAIKKYAEEGGNKKTTVKELSNLNHLFQECTTGSPDEYSKIEQTFSPDALNEMTLWIIEQTK